MEGGEHVEDFEAIYRRYLMEVYRYLLKLSGSSDVAEELTQETFAIVFEKIDRYEDRGKTLIWLCQIAKYEYYSWCRKNKVRTERLDENTPASEDVPLDQIIRREDNENAKRILHGLPEPYREVFLLRVIGEMSFKNIGKIFGKSESWGRVTFFRARKMIAERMGGDDHE
jgi:RNA polymerase sigma-70 factor (ECF subfamily)